MSEKALIDNVLDALNTRLRNAINERDETTKRSGYEAAAHLESTVQGLSIAVTAIREEIGKQRQKPPKKRTKYYALMAQTGKGIEMIGTCTSDVLEHELKESPGATAVHISREEFMKSLRD